MIVYLDSSVLVRAYLVDEPGHEDAVELLADPDAALVTGTSTRIEVSGALMRAARAGRTSPSDLFELLDADLGEDGPVTVVGADQAEVETRALELVRTHGIRSMDAWHLAVAEIVIPGLAEPDEVRAFASRDEAQSAVAILLGFDRR